MSIWGRQRHIDQSQAPMFVSGRFVMEEDLLWKIQPLEEVYLDLGE